VLRLTCNVTGADDFSAACTIASACSSVMTSNADKGRPVCAASAIKRGRHDLWHEDLPWGSDPGAGPVGSQLITTIPNDMLVGN